MAKYQVLRPIEQSGTLYKPKPGPGEPVPKTAKSAGNGREIFVNTEGVIELTTVNIPRFTLGQIGPVEIVQLGSEPNTSQPASTPEPAPPQTRMTGLTNDNAASSRPQGTDSTPVKPEEHASPQQQASAKPVIAEKPESRFAASRPVEAAPSKPVEPVKPAAKAEPAPGKQSEPAKPVSRPEPRAGGEATKPVEPAKPATKAEPAPVKRSEPAKPVFKPEPVAGSEATRPVESPKSEAKLEPTKPEPKTEPSTKAEPATVKQAEPAKPGKPKNR